MQSEALVKRWRTRMNFSASGWRNTSAGEGGGGPPLEKVLVKEAQIEHHPSRSELRAQAERLRVIADQMAVAAYAAKLVEKVPSLRKRSGSTVPAFAAMIAGCYVLGARRRASFLRLQVTNLADLWSRRLRFRR